MALIIKSISIYFIHNCITMYKPYYQLSWFGRNISRPISRLYWSMWRRFGRKHRAVIRFARRAPWWDHYDLYHLLYLKLDEMQEKFDRYGVCVDAELRAEQMRRAMCLMDVVYGDNVDTPYVNFRNIHRYTNNQQVEKIFEQFPDELRAEKAWKLLFRCLEQYSRDWWD